MNREDFDILKTNVIYFDNGATTLKPKVVLDSIVSYYTKYTANAHRGDYNNSLIVDRLYEETRSKVAKFINAFRSDEIVFTKGTTESLNIIVFGFMKHVLTKKDEVILSKAEHASNVLPWLELQKEIGFKIKYVPLDKDLKLTLDNLKRIVTKNTKVISIAHITNTIGDIRPIKEIGKFAKENKIDTLAIVNVYGSSIAREASKTLYINAGCEIAVATTKAYTLQLLMLSFIALAMGIQKELIDDSSFEDIKKYYTKLPQLMHNEIKRDLKNIAKNIYKKNNIFFIGRGIDYALSLEGSLKLKEISYIHSEAYPAGELKHGTISLIEKNTPVIAIVTDENIYEKTISNIKEVASRGAYVILIISKHLDKDGDFYNEKIVIENYNNSYPQLLNDFSDEAINFNEEEIKYYQKSLEIFINRVEIKSKKPRLLLESLYLASQYVGGDYKINDEICNELLDDEEYTKNTLSSSSSKSKVTARFNYVYRKLQQYVKRNKG